VSQCLSLSPAVGPSVRRGQGGPKKRDHRLMAIILSNLNRLKNFTSKFAVKRILKIPPHLAYVATLPWETLMSAKQAVNDKSQNSVAATSPHLKCVATLPCNLSFHKVM